MADRETFVSNSAQDELSFDLPAGATAIEVVSTVGFPGLPFYLTIDADDDTKREIVLVDASKDSDTFNLSTPSNRGVDGTSDVDHDAGALVGVYPVAGLWDDINDRVDAVQSDHDLHTHDGSDTPAVSMSDISGHDKAAHSSFRDVGEVIFYAGTSVPAGFLECDGQAVSRTTFSDLFSEIGTTWGAGDGATTFNLPDLSDSVPVGKSATRAVGDTGGAETHTHGNPSTDSGGSHGHTQGNSGTAGSHAHSQSNSGTSGNHSHSQGDTGSTGSHGHTNPNVNSNGNHAHTNPTTGSGGGHGHGSAGTHDHSMGDGSNQLQFLDSGGVSAASDESHTHDIFNAGSHSHSSVSGHDHNVGNTGSNGNHGHSQGNTGANGNHAHSNPNVAANGNHAHSNPNVDSNGNHAHSNPTTDSGGSHTHTQGDTDAGDSYPPYITLMALIRF